ncbi:hypothetical protein POTOM_009233 [Populus tomentosa]|uniref:Uncharacterized protein n=1 Tax=Populus tomentosa TaxID=118781 RepID=A0A8X8DA23_POPTO|nr:hypothetical protein POTOM_009233 [Populus tomentosa]
MHDSGLDMEEFLCESVACRAVWMAMVESLRCMKHTRHAALIFHLIRQDIPKSLEVVALVRYTKFPNSMAGIKRVKRKWRLMEEGRFQNGGGLGVKVMTDEQMEMLRKQISVYATICEQLVEMHKAVSAQQDFAGFFLFLSLL